MDTKDDLNPQCILTTNQIIVKTFLYRFLALFFTLFFSYIFTRSIRKSLGITVLTELFQTFFYYGFEYCWNNYSSYLIE